jgi:CubicO group peptidase (beta-lactamase class C family)
MNLFWKILIIISVGLVVFFTGFLIWAFKFHPKVEELKIVKEDSQELKVNKADKWLGKLNSKNKFNGAVLLIKGDSILLKKTYGFSHANLKTKLTTNSSLRLASVSKQFTATGIMLLKEKGLLSFDDAITKFLPELSYKKVTIRHLLNHTSGIPDVYMSFPEKYKEEVGNFLTNAKVVKLLGKMNPELENEPNEEYKYSNIGYVLLSSIIERVSEKSFEEFLKIALFDKLDMKNTRVWNLLSKEETFDHKTNSFDNFLGIKTTLYPGILDGVSGDGSVFSSIDDMVIWNQFWYKNDLLSEETMNEAFKKPKLNDGTISNYGFGWIVTDYAVWHNGSWLGARTLIVRNTKLKNTLILLDNSSSASLNNIIKELVKVLK